MTSRTTESFWRHFDRLPPEIQRVSRQKYALWRGDPFHRSLHFKELGDLWSVRITRDYRALARRRGDVVVWFWIGRHGEYDKLVIRI